MRRQKAVWWAVNGTDPRGNPELASPVEIKCRWEDIAGEYRNPRENTIISKSHVYVDREMRVGDYLWEGTLANAPADPVADPEALPIQAFNKIPDLKNRPGRTLLEAFL